MPSFVWKGKNRFGAFQEGILIADTRDAATAILRRQNVQLTSIKEKGRELRLIPKFPSGVGAKRVAIFTRQFSVMLDAGLPLVQCLEILGEQEENRTFREIIQQVTGAQDVAREPCQMLMIQHVAAEQQDFLPRVMMQAAREPCPA